MKHIFTVLLAPVILLGFALIWVLGTLNIELLKLWKWVMR